MIFRYKIISTFLLINIVLLSPLFAQYEKPRTKSWYSKNDRGDYYEGLYTSEIGSFPIEPLGFYAFYEPFNDNSTNEDLNVHFYLPEKGNYFLKAEELYPFQYYWMEDKKRMGDQGWNYFKGWSTKNYLKKLKITKRNLGILVRIGAYNSNAFTPAHVYHTDFEKNISKYIATFRINRSIAKGFCKLYAGYHQQPSSKNEPILIKNIGRRSGGTQITIVFEEEVLNKAAGWYTAEMQLDAKNSSDKIRYHFTFYHQPNLN